MAHSAAAAGHDFFSSLSITSLRKRLSTEADVSGAGAMRSRGALSPTQPGNAPEKPEGSTLLM
jgi:hypothetical protein